MTMAALIEGLRKKAWPKLQCLDIASNHGALSHELVVAEFADGLGLLPCLRGLLISGTGLTYQGSAILLGTLEKGTCPKLGYIVIDNGLKLEWEERLRSRKMVETWVRTDEGKGSPKRRGMPIYV